MSNEVNRKQTLGKFDITGYISVDSKVFTLGSKSKNNPTWTSHIFNPKIDGANAAQIFFKITLPYIMFIMGPYIITQFTGNINNFNVIYLLSAGKPTPVGQTAGKTDLLVTWLYKLTIDNQEYNIGAVIGIMTFVVLSIVALVTYRNTKSYKDEEGFM